MSRYIITFGEGDSQVVPRSADSLEIALEAARIISVPLPDAHHDVGEVRVWCCDLTGDELVRSAMGEPVARFLGGRRVGN